jgi:hypothetical protein
MQKATFARWLLVALPPWVLIVLTLVCLSLGHVSARAAEVAAGQARLLTALEASAPHASLGEHATVMNRLVGTWDVAYTDFLKGGKVRHRTGQITFGWILDGRAVQDLWIVDPSGPGKDREVFTDVFYRDAKSGAWSSVFVDPQEASSATFATIQAADDRLVLESHDLEPAQLHRWSYNDVQADSFVYRDEASTDGGKTWTLKSEYHMSRRPAGSAPSS